MISVCLCAHECDTTEFFLLTWSPKCYISPFGQRYQAICVILSNTVSYKIKFLSTTLTSTQHLVYPPPPPPSTTQNNNGTIRNDFSALTLTKHCDIIGSSLGVAVLCKFDNSLVHCNPQTPKDSFGFVNFDLWGKSTFGR